jgi:hypothetical protein
MGKSEYIKTGAFYLEVFYNPLPEERKIQPEHPRVVPFDAWSEKNH